jgi:hypothetical protein
MIWEIIGAAVLAALSLLLGVVALRNTRGRTSAWIVAACGITFAAWLSSTAKLTQTPVFQLDSKTDLMIPDSVRTSATHAAAIPIPSDTSAPDPSAPIDALKAESLLPPQSWTSEQKASCLEALGRGLPCAVAESIPGMASAALVLVVKHDSLRSVAYEFGLPIERDSITTNRPLADFPFLVENISQIADNLVPFGAEAAVTELIERLRERATKGGYLLLELSEEVQTSEQLRRWRSFFALLSKESLWISDLRHLKERLSNAPRLAMTGDSTNIALFADASIYKAAVTLVTPWALEGLTLDNLVASSDAREVDLYYVGPHAVRLVFDRLRSPSFIATSQLFSSQDERSMYWNTPGLRVLRFSLLLGLISALAATLLQSITSWRRDTRRAFWPESFVYVGFV